MKTYRIFSILLALVLMISAFLYWPQSTVEAISMTVVFGEVQTRGAIVGATDEFVELFNLSASSVDISGYMIKYQSCTGTSLSTIYTVPAGTTLLAYQHYLVTGSGYNGGVPGNGSLTSGIADCAKLQLQTSVGDAVDTFVFTWTGGTVPTGGLLGTEGAYYPNNHNTNVDTSMARFPNNLSSAGGHNNYVDTDVNANDFFTTAASSPENMSSPTPITLLDMTAQNDTRLPVELFGLLAGVVILGGMKFWQKRIF